MTTTTSLTKDIGVPSPVVPSPRPTALSAILFAAAGIGLPIDHGLLWSKS